jgi:hypothetical protein
MQIRNKGWWALLAALSLLTACGGPLKVSSARRTLEYNQGTGHVRVRNVEQDVFLVVELRKPAAAVFAKMKDGKPYFTSGEQRFEVHYASYWEGPDGLKAHLVAVVPRDLRDFELHLEGFSSYRFTADSEISERLKL